VPGTEFTLALDTVVSAVSQGVAVAAGQDLAMTPWNTISVDEATGATNIAGVYAGGDCARGATNIITAIADGKRAAASIDRMLAGENAVLAHDAEKVMSDKEMVLKRTGDRPRAWRQKLTKVAPEQRRRSFDEYTAVLTEEQAVREAARCLACGCGAGCEVCKDICKVFAYSMDPQGRIVLDEEKCLGCGMCAHRCPNQNIEIVQTGTENI